MLLVPNHDLAVLDVVSVDVDIDPVLSAQRHKTVQILPSTGTGKYLIVVHYFLPRTVLSRTILKTNVPV
ncbi:MAG TPA: hypothetical protein PK609_01935 [Candidatus Paceibacterota bacterium]|jgi:hypothetical protein|nr:hypothetical protein [Candidatus Paceibacterota bacterium]